MAILVWMLMIVNNRKLHLKLSLTTKEMYLTKCRRIAPCIVCQVLAPLFVILLALSSFGVGCSLRLLLSWPQQP